MQPRVSIIIAYHNEGQEFIEETVSQIRATADIEDYEIIIVDDCSDVPIAIDGVSIVRHLIRGGVGKAFDTGVIVAKSENIILMGSDIRFIPNKWMSKLVEATEANHKSLICTSCVALNDDSPAKMDIEKRRKVNKTSGASLCAFYDAKDAKSKKKPRTILVAKWLRQNNPETEIIEVPVILGAIYGVRKDWYGYIDGFAGHKHWGTLEPLISIKSYKFGGNCLCHTGIDTGHIFREKSSHGISQAIIYYNKIWAASVLFDDKTRDKLIAYLPNRQNVDTAKKMLDNNGVASKRKEYKEKAIMNDADLLIRMKVKT